MADQFWSTHAPPPIGLHQDDADVGPPSSLEMMRMNRSSSEWAFQRFLREAAAPDHTTTTLEEADDVVEIKENHRHKPETAAVGAPPPNIPVDSEECQAFLKSRLELACAAVALSRATSGKVSESAAVASDICSQTSNSSQYKAAVHIQEKDAGGQVSVPPLSAMSKKSVTQVKSTTSGSSGEQSDDDEAEGETNDPTNAKRMRRMLSNRESARRSRRRKQAHLTELETQGSQLRVENSSLVKRFTDISQKYNEAAVDNRVLKADVETLRAKVKMAEETVKRVTGLNPFFQAMSEISTMGMPSFADSPDTSTADAAVPVQDSKQHYYHAPPNNHISDRRIQNGLIDIPPAENVHPNATAAVGPNKVGTTVSMQRVASLEHLQKHIREGAASGTHGAGEK
ncbi:hypothetical protein BUALT_Bualt19G0057300 [Buddleja alternifolia]|uniref:BZIP domain-containing protein n=1 Tax=Buddleja alternifolia TaxID=168488 RepID=A0AAV6W2E3_9LAMI|nr:hypothetical protein BUALT_Bualt19G0057300 [Buddleja alternifolia]